MASHTALIVVDMQHDFLDDNAPLLVQNGMKVIPLINKLLDSSAIKYKVATKDWHPQNHVSFATSHPEPNNKPFTSFVQVKNIVGGTPDETMEQRLWPVHCVQGTKGAEIVPEINTKHVDLVVNKGANEQVETYSAFRDSFGNLAAGKGGIDHDLTQELKDRSIDEVLVVGIAGDYCVNWTALDCAKAGFKTYVVEEAVKCVSEDAWDEICTGFKKNNVTVVHEKDDLVQRLLR